MASVKKVVKPKGAAKKWLIYGKKILITTIQVNFVQIPGMRQHKLTWIFAIKIFAINLYHHSHFLAALSDFHTGHLGAHLYWLSITKLKNVFKSTIFYLEEFSTDWLID